MNKFSFYVIGKFIYLAVEWDFYSSVKLGKSRWITKLIEILACMY